MDNRIIKFRGVPFGYNDYVYGTLVISTVVGKKHFHIQEEGTAGNAYCKYVDPKSVSESSGVYDKFKKEIYENDIVKCDYGIGKVIFHAGCFMVEWIDDKQADMELLFSRNGRKQRNGADEFTVIGNEFQSPELLK